jgi:cyclic peptide transporter
MNLLNIFQSKSKLFYAALVFLGVTSSLMNLGILMLINTALGGKSVVSFGQNNYLVFLAVVIVSYLATAFFQNYMVELTNSILFDIELSIVQKVRNSTFESYEKLGSGHIFAAISDARILSRVPEIFVALSNAAVTLLCTVGYLFWVLPLGGVTLFALMAVLLVIYLYRNKRIEKDLNGVRDLQDVYYSSLRELLDGFKQVRISALRNDNLFNKFILVNRNTAKSLSIRTSKKYVSNELTGVYSWYLVLGATLFLMPVMFNVSPSQLTAFITAILFIMGPVSQLIMFFPFYTAFKISYQRINRLDKQLDSNAVTAAPEARRRGEFETIRFENVVYRYQKEDQTSFGLEVLDFQITAGEIMFIIGGNGSGKTTFINVLTGLYRPVSGSIYIDEQEVSYDEFAVFANNMATVFTNQYLFRENYDDHDLSDENEQMNEYTDMLNLAGIVKIDKEKNRVDTRISKGQQKRLSLMLALMENKPILILDEWAAEQDPQNRRHFYTKWIQAIRDSGKTVIAVSHDDDFYHQADRVVKFSYGRIVEETSPAAEAASDVLHSS